ncbi:MAG: hypothetical protein K2N06_11195 [Oscillospiraceae bacterium]|nr:hypothetical protein [Oscillospiraceae bacterium]
MLISEYLALRGQLGVTNITTGNVKSTVNIPPEENGSFAEALAERLNGKQGVEFSKHAMQRLSERSIDITEGDTLDRLNKGVEIAADKGSSETLVLVGQNAFVVSVKNNKVITTIPQEELKGNIFTNIDSTVIM